ncbi:unnamed protein product [Linum trigynum]|uniref:Uncharacterized protein n=1 Tax=Linum trigynum TaxID=586398 RepID=A0AAV2EQT8_9ROSI
MTLKQEEYLLEALQYHLRLTKGSNMAAKKVIPNFRTPGPAEVTHMLDGGYVFYHISGWYSGYLSIPIGYRSMNVRLRTLNKRFLGGNPR